MYCHHIVPACPPFRRGSRGTCRSPGAVQRRFLEISEKAQKSLMTPIIGRLHSKDWFFRALFLCFLNSSLRPLTPRTSEQIECGVGSATVPTLENGDGGHSGPPYGVTKVTRQLEKQCRSETREWRRDE